MLGLGLVFSALQRETLVTDKKIVVTLSRHIPTNKSIGTKFRDKSFSTNGKDTFNPPD